MSDPPDIDDLARRYIDLWQQHLTQAANDPELAAGLARLYAGFTPAGQGQAPFAPWNWFLDPAAHRTATAGSAPVGGGGDYDELVERLAALEKRLESLESKPRRNRSTASGGSPKRKS